MSLVLMNSNFGLNPDYLYRELELDSYDCQNALVAGVSKTNWPNFQLTRPLTDIAAVKILEVQIPFTWYFKFKIGMLSTNTTTPLL